MYAAHSQLKQPLPDPGLRLARETVRLLVCPRCRGELELGTASLLCTSEACAISFPVVRGVPVLINEAASLFSIDGLVREQAAAPPPMTWKDRARRFLPSVSRNLKAQENYARFHELLADRKAPVRVLVLGGGTLGVGLQQLLADDRVELVESDVAFGPRTGLICDAHDIPFKGQTFDGVIIQAVLCYLLDPFRCVEEIHRVLKPEGLVYAETPFMQQVTGGKTDFIRFTHLGHRRLFREFTEVSSGPVGGPGMALAWAYKYFLLSFAKSRIMRSALNVVAHITSFWLTYLDYYLIERPGAVDSASGFFFLGKRATKVLPDGDLIELYRGCVGMRDTRPAARPVRASG